MKGKIVDVNFRREISPGKNRREIPRKLISDKQKYEILSVHVRNFAL